MIFITGGVFTDAASDFVELHKERCLTKPFDRKQVRKLVNILWASLDPDGP